MSGWCHSQTIAHSIQNGIYTAVSDGSYSPGFSTLSFILRNQIMGKPNISNNIVSGNPWEQFSYRAEFGGIVGSPVVAKVTCDWTNITKGSIIVRFDRKKSYPVSEK